MPKRSSATISGPDQSAGSKRGGKLIFQQVPHLQRQPDCPGPSAGFNDSLAMPSRLYASLSPPTSSVRTVTGRPHLLHQAPKRLKLLFFAGKIVTIHVHKFGPQQTDAHSATVERAFTFAGQFQISNERNDDAVAGLRRQVRNRASLPVRLPAFLSAVRTRQNIRFRPKDHLTLNAVDNSRITGFNFALQTSNSQHRRDAQGARHDRRVAFGAAQEPWQFPAPFGSSNAISARGQFLGNKNCSFRNMGKIA